MLVTESLVEMMWKDQNIRGFTTDKDHKVALYADDTVLYVTKPTLSLKYIKLLVEMFRRLSGLFMNQEK